MPSVKNEKGGKFPDILTKNSEIEYRINIIYTILVCR